MRRIWRGRTGKKAAGLCLLTVGLCLLLCLLSCFISAVRQADLGEKYSARFAAFLWKEWYPGTVEAETPATKGWLLQFMLRQVPYYQSEREKAAGSFIGEDPAYIDYVESGRILREYEYLVKGLSDSAVFSAGSNPLSPGNLPGKQTAEGGAQAGMITEKKAAGAGLLGKGGGAVTGTRYIEAQLADYDFLMKHFYTVHPTAGAGREMISAENFLSKDLTLEPGTEGPQILIYHTHSQEEFADYGPGNQDATIVGVGSYLTELLEARGYGVIHDTSVYDLRDGQLDRSKAYTYALDGINGILQQYPSIQVVLDVHRDGVKEGTRLVEQVNGKDTATVMFFNGTSQTPTGPIEYLKNSNRADNLAFSFQLKLCADAYYPGFTRKIYLKGLRYNMHVRPRSALIEVGAQTNTYEEARNAMEPLAELLDMVLRPAQ